jgi:hypothetical protein
MDATTALKLLGAADASSQDRGQTMAVALAAQRPQRAGTTRLASPSASRSARRLITVSQLRRIAPLAGRIRRQ